MSAELAPDAHGAYPQWRARWLAANPQWRLLEVFWPAARRPPAAIFELLIEQWFEAAVGIEEPAVARLKLAWWGEELAELASGRPRHPLTVELAKESGVAQLLLPLAAARRSFAQLIDSDAIGSTPQLLGTLEAAAAAMLDAGRIAGLWAPPLPAPTALAAAWWIGQLSAWPSISRTQRGLLPLSVLARAGVGRAAAIDLADPAARRVLVELATELAAHALAEPRGSMIAARIAAAQWSAQQIVRKPQRVLEGALTARPWALLWRMWRASSAAG